MIYLGSEHTINGRSFPMEVHLVHRNMRYSTLAEALAAPAKDGILVMGIFYQVSYQTDDSMTVSIYSVPQKSATSYYICM